MTPAIATRPDVMGGQPCIRGTRIPTRIIGAWARRHAAVSEIREEYPDLTDEQIAEALAYELRHADDRKIPIGYTIIALSLLASAIWLSVIILISKHS